MTGLLQDLRYALRQLRKSPGFTAVAVVTLALGIGANTAIFSVVNALLINMLPVKDPQQLLVVGNPTRVHSRYGGTPTTEIFSYSLYKELRQRNSVFTGLCAAASDDSIEVDNGQGGTSNGKTSGRMVSGNYFRVLGLEPAAGRLFSMSDETADNANPVVVLGYEYWRNRFALSPTVVGKNIRLNGYPFTVVGVAPAGFDGDVVGERMALYVPLTMQPEIVRGRNWLNEANDHWLSLIGRLKPSITAAQAEANLNVAFQQAVNGAYGAALSADDRNAIRELHNRVHVAPGAGGLSKLRGDYHLPLLLLVGMVGLVLLIACVNVANLLIARAAVHTREVALRLAIGATQLRIVQQLLIESLLLAFLGGAAGAFLAVWGVRLLLALLGPNTALATPVDARVWVFTLGISLLTGILFGLFPAIRTLKLQVSPALNNSDRATSQNRSRFGWGKGLIAGQVALSVLVLFSATLLMRSLRNLLTQNFGYNRDHLIIAKVDPVSAGYSDESMKPLATRLVSRLQGTPGMQAITYSTNGLFGGSEQDDAILVPGFAAMKPWERSAKEDYVGPDYFGAVGIPILVGRGIETQDTEHSLRVAVVNEAMVKHFFAGNNPIGRQFKIDDASWSDKPITIIGISRDDKDRATQLREQVEPRFYMAYQQVPGPIQIIIEARVSGSTATAIANITSQIKAVDPTLPIEFIKSLDVLVNESAANQIALAKISTSFAGLALLLACVGLYGLMSYTIAGRTREIGLRMALGAQRTDVVHLILREALLLVFAGVLVGIPLALASSRLLKSFLFGTKATDPVSLITVVSLLGLIAAIAASIPARRAAKVDPMVALRYE